LSEPTVLYAQADGIARLTLNRPARLNAFNAQMHEDMRAALDSLRADASVRVVLLRGAGRAFCSGQDLEERRRAPGAAPPDLGDSINRNYAPLILALRALSVPVVAAVQGVAAGAGANLALACDIVIAARSASFIQPFTRIGLMPDSGGCWVLPRLVGAARARGMTLLAEPVSATLAEQWGLIWRCVDDAALETEVQTVLERLMSAAPLALARTKQALDASATQTLEQSFAAEARMQRELGLSADYAEGVAAFFAKRLPGFNGR
jgi:2-(1,2-epoxy-1,2-dihydrophenyl)acetyl-CoA isomerase